MPSDTKGEFFKCTLFPKVIPNDDYLVNGIGSPEKIDYFFCASMRVSTLPDLCGKDGKFYESLLNDGTTDPVP